MLVFYKNLIYKRTCFTLFVGIFFFIMLLVGCMHNTEPGADIHTDGIEYSNQGEYSLVIFFFNILNLMLKELDEFILLK